MPLLWPVDVVVFLVLVTMYSAIWYFAPEAPANLTDPQRQLVAATVIESCKAALLVAGLFFPILTAVLSLALKQSPGSPLLSPAALSNLRMTTIWIGLSLLIGVLNLARFPGIIISRFLNYDRWTGIFGAAQGIALMLGMVRGTIFLVWAGFS
jgi:hypothetical protein